MFKPKCNVALHVLLKKKTEIQNKLPCHGKMNVNIKKNKMKGKKEGCPMPLSELPYLCDSRIELVCGRPTLALSFQFLSLTACGVFAFKISRNLTNLRVHMLSSLSFLLDGKSLFP